MVKNVRVFAMLRQQVQTALKKRGWQVERIRDPFSDQQTLLGHGNVRVIFDCGANDGETAVSYRRAFPNATIYSFEPSSELYDRLARRSLSNVKPIKLALSDKPGDVTFYEYDISGYNSFARCTEQFVHLVNEVKVCANTIDRFCAETHIDEIDILKLDIQGAELKALRGCERLISSQKIALIYSEVLFRQTYDQQAYYHEIAGWLSDYKYKLFRFYDLRYSPDRQIDYSDAIFCREDIYNGGRLRFT